MTVNFVDCSFKFVLNFYQIIDFYHVIITMQYHIYVCTDLMMSFNK